MSPLSRRSFLRHSAIAATAGLTAASLRPSVWAAPVGANGAIRLGLIGCGAKGTAHVQQILKRTDARVVALCDVDPAQMAKVAALLAGTGPAPFTTPDARTLLPAPTSTPSSSSRPTTGTRSSPSGPVRPAKTSTLKSR